MHNIDKKEDGNINKVNNLQFLDIMVDMEEDEYQKMVEEAKEELKSIHQYIKKYPMESNKYFEDDKNDDDEKFKEKPIKIEEGYDDESEDNSLDRYLIAHAFEFNTDEEFTDEE